MNFLPRNIVKKDFRLTRIYLVIWWAVLALGAIITIWNLNQIMHNPSGFYYLTQHLILFDGNSLQELPYLSNWIGLGLDAVLLTVILDLIFKADSPIDERAEWRTRPVSGLGILRAKLLYLGLFCYLVPGAIQTVENIYLGSSWMDCLRELARFVILQSLWVAIVASAAMLFRRTFTGLLVFSGVAATIFVINQTDNYVAGITLDSSVSSFRDGQPIAWIILGLISLIGLSVSALMYVGSRRKTALFTLVGGMAAAILIYFIGLNYLNKSPEIAPQLDDRVQMAFDSHPISGMDDSSGLRGKIGYDRLIQLELSSTITLRGSPNAALHATIIRYHISWPGTNFLPPVETHTEINARFYLTSAVFNLTSAVAAAGYGRLLNDDPNYPAITLQFSKAQIAQAAAQPAHFQGTLIGEVGRLAVDWDVPFSEHATWSHNQSLFKVTSENMPFGGMGFWLWETNPANLLWMFTPPDDNNSRILLLYNPVKQEALQTQLRSGGYSPETFSVYSINRYYAAFNLVELFPGGNKYPFLPDSIALYKLEHSSDSTAQKENFETRERDRKAFLNLHSQAISDWLAGARLVELHFVPDHPVYNSATIDLPPIITPDVARAAGLPTP